MTRLRQMFGSQKQIRKEIIVGLPETQTTPNL